MNHKEGPKIGLFVKNEASVFGSLLTSVIHRPVHLFDTSCGLKVLIKKGLIKKFI